MIVKSGEATVAERLTDNNYQKFMLRATVRHNINELSDSEIVNYGVSKVVEGAVITFSNNKKVNFDIYRFATDDKASSDIYVLQRSK